VAERICVAQIGAAHGTRGEVRFWSFTADPLAILDYGPLESEDGSVRFEIESLRPAKSHLVARLAGVSDRTAAEKLANVRLYVPRERLPPPADDEFYHADLIEVRPEGASDTVMLPFTETAVPVVDVAGGRIVIDPPQDSPKEQ